VIKFNNITSKKTSIKIIMVMFYCMYSINVFSQVEGFISGKEYILDSISIKGLKNFNNQTVISYSGLKLGQKIFLPGEETGLIIRKLWKLELFSDINFYATKVDGNKISIEIEIKELPTLSNVKVQGIKKNKIQSIKDDTDLKPGKKLSESFLTNTKNYIISKYQKEGYLNTKVYLDTKPDTIGNNRFNLLINIDKGNRVKINSFEFTGNKKIKSYKLRKKMKNTKIKNVLRFWKKSKFIEEDYIEDLEKIVDYYKEKGYRDARIINDTVIVNKNNTLKIKMSFEEGNQYRFGDIKFIGNSAYTDNQLQRVLGINKGEIYNGVLLKKRIADETKPDGEDITNLYQNNGYLFSNINAVEVSAENDTINFEIRVTEGKLANFNKISVAGNDRTNDHVIYRELRTKPGELYSKDQVVRTVRELGQLGFFDAENIKPDFKNVNPNEGTVDIEFGLEETSGSQIELQGGYGGGGFIGTLGLSFGNFSMRNLFNKEAYTPIPAGDGQSLSLRLQASQFYTTTSFSFSEPWLGGRQPVQLSTSLSRTTQYRYDYFTGRADKSQFFEISSISIGLARRLRVPDDYFTLSQSISYQYYNLNNYFTGLFTFGDGESNNIAYTIALSRNNTYTNPVFPIGGSTFTISAKLTPPFSLISGRDYSNLGEEKEFQTIINGVPVPDNALIDQEKFKWLEFYKIKFSGAWYTNIFDKLVLKTQADFGFLGTYNKDRGEIPFERFYLGGDGMMNYSLDGRENIALRGYENQSLSSNNGSLLYNKFTFELRYPISLKPAASIYALSFLESGKGYDSFKDFNPFNSKRSGGFGVRIFMPAFGLLGIDFGYGFDNPNDLISTPNGWETHFIIGQQF
jgi:outer membrane protein insertion porin family